jgi:hypothetical protein
MFKQLVNSEVAKLEAAIKEIESHHTGPSINAVRKFVASVRDSAVNLKTKVVTAIEVGEHDIENFLGDVKADAVNEVHAAENEGMAVVEETKTEAEHVTAEVVEKL